MEDLAYLIDLVEDQNAMIYDLQRQVAYLTSMLVVEEEEDDDEG